MNPENVNFTAPQGQITQSFVAPDMGSAGSRVKNENVQLMPAGPNPGIIYAIVDLGTQNVQFGANPPEEKRQLYVGIEFPQLKQFFYVGDTEPRSTVASDELNMFITAENSNLRHFIHSVIGRSLTNEESKTFNLFSLIGMKVGVDIEHKISKRTNQPYMKVKGYFTMNENFNIPQNFVRSLEPMAFAIDCDPAGNVIGNNFRTENFAKIFSFIKAKILTSKEAKKYAQNGGVFAKMPENTGSQQSASPTFQNTPQTPAQSTPVPPPVQNNIIQPPVQQPPVQQMAPPAQQPPQAPQVPQTPSADIPDGYQMADPNGAPIGSYLSSGWSVEQLIQHRVLVPKAGVIPPANNQPVSEENDVPF